MDTEPETKDDDSRKGQMSRSGGADFAAERVNVGQDVVGRDKNIFLGIGPRIGIAALLLFAVTAVALVLILRNTGGGDTFNVAGTQFNGDVAFNTVNVIVEQAQEASGDKLPASVVETLNQAMAYVQSREFEKAIPLLESVAEAAPVPALYNNLGGAYLATGDEARAASYLARAANEKTARDNLSRLGPIVSSQIPDVSAQLIEFSRFENTVTVKVRFLNFGEAALSLLYVTRTSYLLDEATHDTHPVTLESNPTDAVMPAGGSVEFWAKYAVPEDWKPQYVTVVWPNGIIFEHLTVP